MKSEDSMGRRWTRAAVTGRPRNTGTRPSWQTALSPCTGIGLTWDVAYAGRVPGTSPPAELSRPAFVAELGVLTQVYAAAMRPDPAQLAGRRSIMEQHTRHGGFRALAVRAEDHGRPGQIIGFSYGFRGADGQWWHDTVAAALTAKSGPVLATAWLANSLEIAEVHVLPAFQHRGIGKSLVLGLAEGRRERTAVLSTPDAESTARRLYRGLGFEDLLTGYRFPGADIGYAVMGAVLPLRDLSPRPRSS
jgi:ribosomal protein S18 acetylase RimI-like enzyme